MTQFDIVAWMGGAVAVVAVLYLSVAVRPTPMSAWMFPAGLSLLFCLISVRALLVEGPVGFWSHHTQDLWGNQIWFDLLLGVSAALAFMIPRARAVKMRVIAWVILCLATGSIGLYAFISRLLFLESRCRDTHRTADGL